jgi:hypothetical protein
MKYILGLSLEYHRFQRDAIVRVYADDRMVDEFSLTDDIKLKVVEYNSFPAYSEKKWYHRPKNFTRILIMPKKLFLFEIDQQYLNNRIRIEVKNENSNYVNGFMTKHSYLRFHDIMLVPCCLLDNWNRLERFVDTTEKGPVVNNAWPRQISNEEIELRSDSKAYEGNFWNYAKGGSFTVDLPLSRKHNIVHLGRMAPGNIKLNRDPILRLWAFNSLNMTK